ncbi:Uncharacterised protein [Mycobacteroides abscessus subsp. abscessus]|nr:Uncharacterised protein [Mycobacteroides abscessus subsp. abscessus]
MRRRTGSAGPATKKAVAPSGVQNRTVCEVVRSERNAGPKTTTSAPGKSDRATSRSPSTWLVIATHRGATARTAAATSSSRSPGRVVSTTRSHESWTRRSRALRLLPRCQCRRASVMETPVPSAAAVSLPSSLPGLSRNPPASSMPAQSVIVTRRVDAASRAASTPDAPSWASSSNHPTRSGYTACGRSSGVRVTTTVSCRSPNSAAPAMPIAPAPWKRILMAGEPAHSRSPRPRRRDRSARARRSSSPTRTPPHRRPATAPPAPRPGGCRSSAGFR